MAKRSIPDERGRVRNKCGAAKLLHLGDPEHRSGDPVVLIPSLVNSHHILDLTKHMSLARYLARQGHDPWLVDWGYPQPDDANMGIAGHIENRLLPMLRSIGRPASLIGYCLGGTMALAAAQIVPVRACAVIAAPWHFSCYPESALKTIRALWHDAKPLCERLGYVPMEILQTGFWALDPQRTIQKYAAFAEMTDGSDEQLAFLAIEDWANGGAPLTFGAAQDLFEQLYSENVTGTGRWIVAGKPIVPERLTCPAFSIYSTSDKIVPAATSPVLTDSCGSTLGHVGMIVSARAREQIWSVLAQWLSANKTKC